MKPRRISNQPTYKPRSYKFSSYSHILHKVHNIIEIHRSLKHKVITKQVHNKVAEAVVLRLHTHTSFELQCQLRVMSIKASGKTYGATMPLVLVVVHRGIQTVDAISIVHLVICNNNRNKVLSTRMYSAKLTCLKRK
jgi:hypothetical protein